MDADIAVKTEYFRKFVANSIRGGLKGFIGSEQDQPAVVNNVYNTLNNLKHSGAVSNWSIKNVWVQNPGPLRQVGDMASNALPGDVVYDEDGSFRGMIVSHDGEGNGVVFDSRVSPLEPPVITISLNVQPTFPINWISMDFKI